jgi:hypothetical protein
MKTVSPPRREENVLVVRIDPLRLLGARRLPRGGTHGARRPSRAHGKRDLRRQLAEG